MHFVQELSVHMMLIYGRDQGGPPMMLSLQGHPTI